MNINKITIASVLLIALTWMGSCKKFIEVSAPVTSVNAGNVYANDYTAIASLTSLYAEMSNNGGGTESVNSLSLFPELGADNLTLFDISNGTMRPYYQNDLTALAVGPNTPPRYWLWFYQYIYQVNAALEGIDASNTLTPAVKLQLTGEALFIRAFCYFYLVNLYGDVPLVISTNYKVNASLSRTDISKVYLQIIQDLQKAQSILSDDYKDVTLLKTTIDRIRPNKGTATALLSRVYLYREDYTNAEAQASLLLENNANYVLVDLDKVFKMNSPETIWALQPVVAGQNTWEAAVFTIPTAGPRNTSCFISNQLLNGFETNDQRLTTWIGSAISGGTQYYYPSKYKAITGGLTEYEIVFRLSEQYLIRAEARAQLGKYSGSNSASSDLNAIRERAGLLPFSSDDKTTLLDEILKERQRELFTEWGARWFDLKRLKKIDAVMNIICPLKGGIWESYKALYPIDQAQINVSPGMKDQQNPGYN